MSNSSILERSHVSLMDLLGSVLIKALFIFGLVSLLGGCVRLYPYHTPHDQGYPTVDHGSKHGDHGDYGIK